MLKKVAISVLIYVAIIHSRPVNGKLLYVSAHVVSDKLQHQDIQDCKQAPILHAWEKMLLSLAPLQILF